MLDKQHEVWYQARQQDPPRKVRILLFDQAIQLYDAADESFIGAFAVGGIRLIETSAGAALLQLLPDGYERLTVSVNHLLWPELNQKLSNTGKFSTKAKKHWKWPVLLLVIAGGLLGIYFLLISLITGIGLQLVSTEKERELGEMIYASMAEGLKIDSAATDKLTLFANELKLSEEYKLNFTVVDEKEINAFAIPGGRIVVYKGILEEMKEPEELVALLGHEASHVNERHSLRSILRQLSGSVLLSMVFGDLGSIGSAVVGQADQLRSLSYSRSLEEEADASAMDLMRGNKVDPRGMIGLMDRLKKAESGAKLPGFLSTHPLTTDRKATAEKYIRQFPQTYETPAPIAESWKQLRNSISGLGKNEW